MPSESEQHTGPYTVEEWNRGADMDAPRATFEPAPERTRAVNFDYRGTEQHGVAAMAPMERMADSWSEGAIVPVDVSPPTPQPDPVPVVIVSDDPAHIKDWRAGQAYATGTPSQVVNKKSGRTTVQIQNLSVTVPIWIGPDAMTNATTGYRLAPGASFSLECESAIWAVSGDGNPTPLCWYMEFEIQL